MFPDAREKSCGLNMFMLPLKSPVFRQPFAAVRSVAAYLCFVNSSPVLYRMTKLPGFERNHFSISWQQNVFGGPMKALSKGCTVWLL
jgi:hypothetical protein